MRKLAISVVMAILVAAGVVVAPSPVAADRLFVSVFIDVPGPKGGIAVVGDSVMLGSAYGPPFEPGWGPSLAHLLADHGWGPVRMAAGVGFQAGSKVPAHQSGANMSLWLTNQRASGFDPPVIVVSLGPNDIIACNGNVECAADDIRGFMDVAGADHEVWWALQTAKIPTNQEAWNQALQIVAAERPNLMLWDWPTIRVAAGIGISADNTHLPGAPQYQQRSTLIADDVTTRLAGSRQIGAEVAAPPGGASYEYDPVDPVRVVDTRETGGRLAAGGTLVVDLSLAPAAVGVDAAAAAVNVTAAAPGAAGFLTVWPCGTEQPLASSVNFLAGQARGAQATTLLGGPAKRVCIFSNAPTDVVVDLQGVFVPTGALRFAPIIPPERKLDTRQTVRASTNVITAPPGAEAVAATLTVTGGSDAGFLTAFPCSGTIPVASNVNWQRGETVAGAVFVPVAANDTFCVFTNSPVDVIVDITGVFNATNTLRFTPVTPTRMVDTRVGTGGWRGHQGVGQTIEIGAAPDAAEAVTGTITQISPGVDGYLTGTTCGQPPGATSSVNGARGSVMANSLTVGLSAGGNLCITSLAAAHTLFDTTGWWMP